MYRITEFGQIQRIADSAFIPDDPANGQYQDYKTWLDEGGVPELPPPPTLTTLKRQKTEALAAQRYAVETGGVTLPGLGIVPTDRTTQERIGQTLAAMDRGFVVSVKWKLPDGFVDLGKVQLEGIAQAVARHVQACFDREANLRTAIDAAPDQETLDAIDIRAGWPGVENPHA